MKKTLVFSVIIILLFSYAYADGDCGSKTLTAKKKITRSEKYYPLSVGNELYFKAYKKENPDEKFRVKAEVKGIEEKDGEDFFYMYAPQFDIRYLLKRDENGVYMRMIKYPFLFFGSIEVHMRPPLNFFKFPAKVGLKWEENIKAEATFLFFPISRDIHGEFEIVKRETIKTDAGDIDAYKVHARVNQGEDEKDVKDEYFWYAKGFGYAKADTAVHFAEVVGYKIKDEETGEWNEKLPENPEEYK